MSETTTPTARPANAGHCTYPGDCRGIVGEVKGPTLMREYLVAVEAAHDTATHTTRVGWDYARRDDILNAVGLRLKAGSK